MRYICILSFFLFSQIQSTLQDHFKKIEDKSGCHNMRNIDFIYLINLDSRPEKLEKTLSRLSPYEIYPCRVSAVNGKDLSVEALQDIGLKYAKGMKKILATTYLAPLKPTYKKIEDDSFGYFRPKMLPGMVGCLLSHLSVLQDAYDSGYSTIWVLEDDIVVVQDPRKISDLIDALDRQVGKDGWDILFTDRDFRGKDGKYKRCTGWSQRPNFKPSNPKKFEEAYMISETFRCIGARFGTHSMILRRTGIEKILEFIKAYQPFNPIDLDMYLPEGIRLFSVVQDVVTNEADGVSDTRPTTSN